MIYVWWMRFWAIRYLSIEIHFITMQQAQYTNGIFWKFLPAEDMAVTYSIPADPSQLLWQRIV